MPFGQSYLAFRFISSVGKNAAKIMGADEEEARDFGNTIGGSVGGVLGVVTGDPAGVAATTADIMYQNRHR